MMIYRRRRAQRIDSTGESTAWMITFSDLATLLLTFFVLLLSMSSLNKRVFRNTFQNFDKSSGILQFRQHDRVIPPPSFSIQEICKSLKSVHAADIRDLDEVSQEELGSESFNLVVSSGNAVWMKKNGTTGTFSFIFSNKLLFEAGSAVLSPTVYPVLEKLGGFLRDSDYCAYIYGHTDDAPVSNERFRSNDALSIARAQSVLDFFLEHSQVDPSHLALGGYGSSCPLVVDDKIPAAKALNRRVEIVFEKVE